MHAEHREAVDADIGDLLLHDPTTGTERMLASDVHVGTFAGHIGRSPALRGRCPSFAAVDRPFEELAYFTAEPDGKLALWRFDG